MRVAIVLNTSWNVYNFRMNFIRALKARGYEVHVIAPYDEYAHFLSAAGCIYHRVRMDSKGTNPVKDLALTAALWKIYREIRPDVVLQYTVKPNIYGTLAATLLRIPAINNVCGLGTVFLRNGFSSSLAILLYRIAFRFPEKVFFQNPDDLHLFIKRKLVKKEVTGLVPGSGVDLKRFTPTPLKGNRLYTFLLVSRLILDKGIAEYVSAGRLLKAKGVQVRLQLLGFRETDHKWKVQDHVLQQWIEEGIIEYLGYSRDVRPFISAADCIVLPSYREGTPRALLEAAGCGRPIITTDVAGCRSVVVHGYNGLLCRAKDAADLAEKMHAMSVTDHLTLHAYSRNGRKKVEEEFDDTIVTERYLEVMEKIKTRCHI